MSVTCAIIKHTQIPDGVESVELPLDAFRQRPPIPLFAFGGINIAFLTKSIVAAEAIVEMFAEVIIAPDIDGGSTMVCVQWKGTRAFSGWRGSGEDR